ncbi:MAG: hypothetical protein NTX53_12005 [candidate division WOR-3 bacterium]|nr:hypothetical protein [candidate division WOR-3 bacterium]
MDFGIRTCTLALAIAGLAGLVFAAPSVVTLHIEKQVPLAAGQGVVVLHRYGSVFIASTSDAHAVADALVRVTAASRQVAEEFARKVDVGVSSYGDTAVVATLYPAGEPVDSQLGFEVELTVHVPANVGVAVRSSFSDVRVAGMTGESRVSNRFGDVEIDRCTRCGIDNSYGSVRLVKTSGLVTVRNSYGDVDVREAAGPVQVANRYGTVRTGQSDGEVQIDNRFGNVIAHPDHGRLSIANRYGDINAWVASTELTALNIMSRLGRVDLSLTGGVPFQLDASALQGRISSGFPFVVHEVGARQLVSVRQGTGGPRIGLDGAWSNFVIHQDTAESMPAAGPE